MEKTNILKAQDCLEFHLNSTTDEKALEYFLQNCDVDNCLFNFINKREENSKIDLAEYDFREKRWRAGRFVGSAKFKYIDKGKEYEYELVIEPRFGEKIFFKMIEEIFNIKIVNNQMGINKGKNSETLMKKLIAIIWLKKLSAVNKHGFPRKTVKKQHKGYNKRGRILIPQTIIPHYTEEKIISQSYEKENDYVIARIILEAYNKLNKFGSFESSKLSKNIKQIIHDIQNMSLSTKKVTQQEYNNIRYKAIYLSYKEIVDLSWLIIKSKYVTYDDKNNKNVMALFIDMAEVWEMYVKTILEKRFKNEGWKISSKEIEVYQDTFFKRKLIPDIIMEKEDKVVVLDAKYKKMEFRKFDLDRNDFFQIHTYMSYYLCQNRLLCGGLIYPFTGEIKNNISHSLFQKSDCSSAFFIDGINIKENENITDDEYIESFEEATKEFVNRIAIQIK